MMLGTNSHLAAQRIKQLRREFTQP